MRAYFFVFLAIGMLSTAIASERHAVILLYHHVSAETPASTSVTPAQFDQHLSYLAENGYRVWPLRRALDAVLRGVEEVPDKVVAITFDDAYESVFTRARPRLKARGWPYTVFVNTNAVDAGHEPYMSWDRLRILANEGVAIENHGAAHDHMSRPLSGESERDWQARVREDIATAYARIGQEVGQAPLLFAYPYGEDSPKLAEVAAEKHDYALVQRSGPVGASTDRLGIPRFPMATGFASPERLELALRSRPLPVSLTRTDRARPVKGGDIDWIELRVESGGFAAAQLNCFAGNGRRLEVATEGDGPYRVRIDVDGVGKAGRNKINCTAPAADGSGDFYWFSYQWLVDSPGTGE